MSYALALSVLDRFAFIIEGVCRAVAARHRHLDAALLVAVWTWLRRLPGQVAAMPRPPCAVAPPPLRPVAYDRPAPCRPAAPRVGLRLPARRGWLSALVPEAQGYAEQLRHLLGDPELAAMLRATPALGPLLRRLCWSLHIDAGAALPPPRRSVRRRSRQAPVAQTRLVLPRARPPTEPPWITSPWPASLPGAHRRARP